MTDEAAEPTYDKKKLWKLALLVVPALLSGMSSYLKSRAEATEQDKATRVEATDLAKATFEHMEEDIDELQEAVTKVVEMNYMQTAEIAMLKEQLAASQKRAATATAPAPLTAKSLPTAKPPRLNGDMASADMDSLPAKPEPAPTLIRRNKSGRSSAERFDEVVQTYKSKK
jgi:hypothetical protein